MGGTDFEYDPSDGTYRFIYKNLSGVICVAILMDVEYKNYYMIASVSEFNDSEEQDMDKIMDSIEFYDDE